MGTIKIVLPSDNNNNNNAGFICVNDRYHCTASNKPEPEFKVLLYKLH